MVLATQLMRLVTLQATQEEQFQGLRQVQQVQPATQQVLSDAVLMQQLSLIHI